MLTNIMRKKTFLTDTVAKKRSFNCVTVAHKLTQHLHELHSLLRLKLNNTQFHKT